MINFHPDTNFNYQMNRAVYLSGADENDLRNAAARIHNCADWKKEFILLGDKALSDGELERAASYYRLGEFFMFDGDDDKLKYYSLATELFYKSKDNAIRRGEVVRDSVRFGKYQLPVLFKKAKKSGKARGTILLHGGNDSYLEEFWSLLNIFSAAGYDTYIFEGPGQGGVLRKQGVKFISQWEKPVKAILDHFNLDGVTIIGMSLGGLLAQRAAAFEKRISHVVAWTSFTNLQDVMIYCRPPKVQAFMKFCLRHNLCKLYNKIIAKKIAGGDYFLEWGIKHGMYAYDAATPFDYLKKSADFQINDVIENITQDVLLLGAREDHVVPCRFTGEELNRLTSAHSVTARIFSEKENAGLHCNVDNTELAVKTILNWLEQIKSE